MDKQPVGQLPDLASSNNDDEIMVITNSEYNQLKKEKISDFITDLTSTNENNALTKGTDGKMFVTDFGNASNITEGTLPTSVLPEIPLEKIPDIPKDKLPPIETSDLPVSGVTADTYAYPSSVTVNAQGQITGIVEGAPGANNANQDLSNLSEIGEKHFINKTQITNCILEIPQNINLEFNNGTLTLKKGSVVVVPNGMSGSTPQYTYKTISNDISTSTISNGTGLSILMITPSNGFTANAVGAVSSGATAPSSGQLWYDTAKNLIKTSSNNGESWTIYTGVSLPIGIITRNTGDITSLNQIFNGFGIIGSTIWCDKGVKAFIPNGRNTDGTLNNIEITTSTVKLINRDIPSIGMWHFTLTSNGDIVDWDDYKIVQSYNDITINTCLYYVINENRMYYRTSQGIINENKNCYIGTFYNSEDSSNGRITALNTKLSYRAMDYNDFINNGISNIICTTAPTTVSTASAQRPAVVVENYVNGTSGYYVRSDGYCEQWGYVLSVNKTTTITLLKKMIDTNYSIVCTGTESTGGGDNGSMNAYNPTTTGFNIYNTSDNISNCYWKATGYIS